MLAGRPMLEWCSTRCARRAIDEIVVALPPGERARPRARSACAGGDVALGVGARRAGGRAATADAGASSTTPRGRWSRPSSFARALAALGGGRRARSPPRRWPTRSRRPTPTASCAHARPLARCGRCRRRRCSAAPRWSARSTCDDECSPRPPTTPGWSSAPAAACASWRRRPRTSRSRRRTTCASPSALLREPMLTDYHVHLRPDDVEHRRPSATSPPPTPSATARWPPSAGSTSSASPSTSTASAGARRLAAPVLAPAGARRPRRLLRVRARARPTCGSASRPTSCPAREDRMANLLEARDWDYVVGSVHFLARRRRRHATASGTSGGAATRPSRSGSATSRRSPRPRAAGCSTSSPTPTWSRSGAAGARGRRATCAATTSSPMEAIADAGIAIEVSTAGLRKPVGEIYPAPAVPRDVRSRPACRSRCPATRTRPRTSASATSGRWSCCEAAGVSELARVRAPRAAAGADRVSVAHRHRLRLAPPRRGAPAGPRRRGDPARARAGRPLRRRRAHPRVIDALLGAAGLGDIGEHFPDTDERWRGRRLARAAARGRGARARDAGWRGRPRRRDGDARAARSSAPHRAAMRARLAGRRRLALGA